MLGGGCVSHGAGPGAGCRPGRADLRVGYTKSTAEGDMKRIARYLALFGCVVAVVAMSATPASAQVPSLHVVFDDGLVTCEVNCPPGGMGTLDTLYVVARNVFGPVSSISYRIDYGPSFVFLGDIFSPEVFFYGNSASGAHATYRTPANYSNPHIVQRVTVLWNCNDCSSADSWVRPLPHPNFTDILAITQPSDVAVPLEPFPAFVCSVGPRTCPYEDEPIPVFESTWGQIKAMYR